MKIVKKADDVHAFVHFFLMPLATANLISPENFIYSLSSQSFANFSTFPTRLLLLLDIVFLFFSSVLTPLAPCADVFFEQLGLIPVRVFNSTAAISLKCSFSKLYLALTGEE